MDAMSYWNEYGLGELKNNLEQFFPDIEWNMQALFEQILSGDVLGAFSSFFKQFISSLSGQAEGLKSMLVWILVLGVISALFKHFGDMFENRQISDISFYFLYMLLVTILMQGYREMAQCAAETVEQIVVFMQLFIPTYLVAVGASGGTATAYGYYQVAVILLYGVEKLVQLIVLPLVHGFTFCVFMNGIWGGDRLLLVMSYLKKAVGFGTKAALATVTAISFFQSLILPAVDSLKNTTLQKAVGAIPGIGDAAEGISQVVLGSAVLIKNSIGVLLLILLLVLCAFPVLKIALLACAFKGCAALVGMAGDKKVCDCVDKIGDAGFLLLKVVLTIISLFMIVIAIAAYTTG